jgi:hypothetical protein
MIPPTIFQNLSTKTEAAYVKRSKHSRDGIAHPDDTTIFATEPK